jgi:transcriptional regulator with XRE-family HTH domain
METQQMDDPTPAEVGSNVRSPRKVGAYERPTPEKIAFGARLMEAREIAGLTQLDAASAMGYSQQVQFSLWESGQRMPPLDVVIRLARLYGTTTDFLCGLAPDSDPDPVVSVQRVVAAAVTADVRRLIQEVATVGADAVRTLRPNVAGNIALAQATLRVAAALSRVRSAGSAFDEQVKGGSSLVREVAVAAELARSQVDALERAQRLMQRRRLSAVSVALDGPETALGANFAGYLEPWVRRAAGEADAADPGEADSADQPAAAESTPIVKATGCG